MRRPDEAGFTLVEMLVALTIFSLLAVAGVGILRASVNTQDAVDRGLSRLSGKERIAQLVTADAGQAIARSIEGNGSGREAPFDGSPTRMSLMRAGWANPGDAPRSTLQRVEWRFASGGVERVAHLFLDGSDPGQPAILDKDAGGLRFRYRKADSSWSDNFRSNDKELLPAAVEVTVEQAGRPPLTIIAAMPPRGVEPQPVSPPEPSGAGESVPA